MIEAEDIEDKEAIAAKGDVDELVEARKRADDLLSTEQESRQKSVSEILFVDEEGAQWDDFASNRKDGRVKMEFNRIAGAIDQIVGEQRKQDISIKYRPTSKEHSDVAKINAGITKNIEECSSARDIIDSAFGEMLKGGYGGWQIGTRWSDTNPMDQEAVWEPIDSATTSLFFDPGAQKYDKSDALYAFLFLNLQVPSFKAQYPGKVASDAPDIVFDGGTLSCSDWHKSDTIRVAQYWRKVPIKQEIVLVDNGKIYEGKEFDEAKAELSKAGIVETRRRTVDVFKVESRMMSGAEWLEPWKEYAGTMFPLVPLFGKVTKVDGKVIVRGMVRPAKDAQRSYNYSRSSEIEQLALAPNDPYWMTAKQVGIHGTELARLNIDNPPIAIYDHDPEAPGVPQRTGAVQIQPGFFTSSQQAIQDLNATLNVVPSAVQPDVGTKMDTRSGVAIAASKTNENTPSFVYIDNLIKSLEHTGRILADLIPNIYDGERQVRIINPDGTEEFVLINQTVQDPEDPSKHIILNDLTQAKMDVVVDTGPAFATMQNEAANKLIELATSSPLFAELTPDILAKNLDIPGSDELHDRLRKDMIQKGIAEPTEEETEKFGLDQPQEPSRAEQLAEARLEAEVRIINANAADLEASAASTMAGIPKQQADAVQSVEKGANLAVDTNLKAVKAVGENLTNIQTQHDMGLPLNEQEHDIRIGQNDLVEDTQETILPGGTSEEQTASAQVALEQIANQQFDGEQR
jgi:hypothetical protein